MLNSKPLARLLIAITVFGVLLICRVSSAQESTELSFILSSNPLQDNSKLVQARPHSASPYAFNMRQVLKGAIRFYQLFISPQDMPVCNFVPSCSQFSAEVIGRLGILRGVLLTSDRLQRCNGISISRYRIDYNSGRFIDPVQIYCELLQ